MVVHATEGAIRLGRPAFVPGLTLFTLFTLLTACGVDRVALDGQCSFDSDCQELLVCAAQRCRAQCREDRDCDEGARCVGFGIPATRACVPPASPDPCAYNSDCPAGAVCRDGTCRLECLEDRDCAEGDRCVDGSCTLPLPPSPPPGGDAGVPDAGGGDTGTPPDAGTPDARPPGTDAAPPCTACGSLCVDLSSSPRHCGGCGNACGDGESCFDGECRPGGDCGGEYCCPFGYLYCGHDSCADLENDPKNCGDCERVCDPGVACRTGGCVPTNDECEGALPLDVSSGSVSVLVDANGASHSEGTCQASRDVFYTFELTERSIVLAGGHYVLGWGVSPADAPCAAGVSTCVAEGCTSYSAGMLQVLEAGRYRLTVELQPQLWLRSRVVLQVAPIGSARATRLTLTDDYVSGDTSAATASPGVAACGAGPSDLYYFATCGDAETAPFEASLCDGTGFDTVLSLESADGVLSTCGDDDACGLDASLARDLYPGAVLYLLRVGGKGASGAGAYGLSLSFPDSVM